MKHLDEAVVKEIFLTMKLFEFLMKKLPDGTKAVIIQENIKKLQDNFILFKKENIPW